MNEQATKQHFADAGKMMGFCCFCYIRGTSSNKTTENNKIISFMIFFALKIW
jgi:hypothetical protein